MIVVIAHAKGGVGKTTLALNIASEFKTHLIIDQDLHNGLSILNGFRKKPYKLLANHSEKDLINTLAQHHDKNIIIDCGGFDSDINRKAIAASDLLIVPTSDSPTEIIGLRHFDKTIKDICQVFKTNIKASVVLTRIHPSRTRFDDVSEFVSGLGSMQLMKSVIHYYADFQNAMSTGQGVLESPKTKYGKAAKNITSLLSELKIYNNASHVL